MIKIPWDDYFMTMVYLASTRSKDEHTKVGAVIVDDLNIIMSVGYNSFVRGINDCVSERQERPEKYFGLNMLNVMLYIMPEESLENVVCIPTVFLVWIVLEVLYK